MHSRPVVVLVCWIDAIQLSVAEMIPLIRRRDSRSAFSTNLCRKLHVSHVSLARKTWPLHWSWHHCYPPCCTFQRNSNSLSHALESFPLELTIKHLIGASLYLRYSKWVHLTDVLSQNWMASNYSFYSPLPLTRNEQKQLSRSPEQTHFSCKNQLQITQTACKVVKINSRV